MKRTFLPIMAAVGLVVLAACGSSTDDTAAPETTPTSQEVVEEEVAIEPELDECSPENLTTLSSGKLTIDTDTPAYPPYFVDDDPTNGKGFESAVAYAVAEQLGFTATDVVWEVVPFNVSYAPGDKNFDFDINQISITEDRKKAVDFSDGYYTVNQAVVALKDSPIAGAASVGDLKDARLGAQVGTTSLAFITDVVQPSQQPQVYNDTNDAKSAMQNGQLDGLVVDLPTAYYITAVEIPDGSIIGQFPAQEGGEEFGLLFQKGNPLVTCVNRALGELKASGQLQAIQDEWLAGTTAPYFKE
jgi:polar amino acid transport system substrate-binding protein